MRVEELMTREVVAVSPEVQLKEVARLLVEHGVSGVPVVDADGVVLGVVSEGDIVVREEGYAPAPSGPLSWLVRGGGERRKLMARTAGEAMTSPAVTIEGARTVAAAARLMVECGVKRLPVVHDGRLIGIVTRADLVRAFIRSDEEIEREIKEDVLLRSLWIEPHRIEVVVDEGRVALTGLVSTRTEAELAPAFTRRVPGVVSVDSDALAWEVDDLSRRASLSRG